MGVRSTDVRPQTGARGNRAATADFRQLRRSDDGTAGACRSLRPLREDSAKQVDAPPVRSGGQGNPGCRAVSVTHLLVDDNAPWDLRSRAVSVVHLLVDDDEGMGTGMPCLGMGSGWGAASRTHERLSQVGKRSGISRAVPVAQSREGLAPATGRVPSEWRSQLQTAELCPAGEGIKHSSRRTGPRKKNLNTPTNGPRCLQRATSIRSGSAPSWAILRRARAEGCPQVSRAGNTGKPDNGVIVARTGVVWKGLAGPTAQSVHSS